MPVRTLPLYLDTSVIGGYFDDEFEEATRELWRQKEAGRFRFTTSAVTRQEIEEAPADVRELMEETFPAADLLPLTVEAIELARAYLDAAVVPETYADDARHVAIAVVHELHLLVSWNFRHMVNVRRSDAFNAVNLLQGYPPIRIVSPLELIYDDEEEQTL